MPFKYLGYVSNSQNGSLGGTIWLQEQWGWEKVPSIQHSIALHRVFLTQQFLLIHLLMVFSLYNLEVGDELKVA